MSAAEANASRLMNLEQPRKGESGKRLDCGPMIMVTIIHNYEIDRLKYLRPRLRDIFLDFSGQITVTECASNLIAQPTTLDLFFRNLKVKKTQICLQTRIYKFSRIKSNRQYIKSIWRIVRAEPITKAKALSEMNLADKHFKSCRDFLHSSAEHLIVLESDAIIENGKRLLKLLNKLNCFSSQDFICLTWPFSNLELGLPEFSDPMLEDVHSMDLQITNTTAGYVLSRELAAKLLDQATKGIFERTVAIDWFMNECFMNFQREKGWSGMTIVPNNELIVNGSLAGEYVSGI